MKLYFGNMITMITTISLLGLLVYIGYSFMNRSTLDHWGRRIIILLVVGLVVCCFAVTRDNYHHSVQHAIDGSIDPGLFTIKSIQSNICCMLAGVIVLSGIVSIFMRNQDARQICFFIIAVCICLKIGIIEVSRVSMYLS
ncbi:uncharacterized membrane protein HdeD (DUF308 family) [Breznakia sp. PF5-3]|uniref:hypothetical protein n=1 Tax=unclassified Breznakia TaxID=2623764 RepID=UPI0024074A7F|nr:MULTISPECIES: hypothetical protein [unclassified Breznakia]MDL2276919.1 hypothetical protein [Breznakia sp. OttesenSCG-928-G09]MDF9825316.1 uncharacterized membrane protein HdeD (DUF308 family) [Breznakia sp. PM6-1]MDF9836201.1 uncharacterized membrane protein HdeD (DUF308 family) [Breznakia sp. PF5-3]MDF9838430.1 uncharacterized membrane protein HdeD (DUF308 family) [Breznakia sp. PFB2-8]MDF9860446.1 uncharacterized membrane protein HdeD (DUF308 family) [Breznakia sp. PH5-24]